MPTSGSGNAIGDIVPPEGDAPYSGLYEMIAAALDKPESFWTPAPDALMVQLVAREIPIALRKVPCLTSGTYDYGALSGANKIAFDAGFVEIVADMLRRRINANANDGRGQVVEEHAGTVSEKFASGGDSSSSQAMTQADVAARELGWPSWLTAECVRSARIAAEGQFRTFGPASRSRACCGGSRGGRW